MTARCEACRAPVTDDTLDVPAWETRGALRHRDCAEGSAAGHALRDAAGRLDAIVAGLPTPEPADG